MALVVEDRVRETSTTAGTGTFTLAGAVTGYQSFAAVGNGNTTYYTIYLQGGNEWEVGIGTYTSSGTTLSRDTVLASSTGGAKINFSAGVKDVFVTYPADRSVYYDSATNVTLNALTLSGGTDNGVAFLNGSKVLTTGSALTFDGTGQLVVNRTGGSAGLILQSNDASTSYLFFGDQTSASVGRIEYDHGTNGMPFYVSGSEVMRLTSTGLKASIAGTNADPVFSYTSDTNTGIFFPAADKLGFVAGGGSDQMVLTTTGLGIGTNSPATNLHVKGTANGWVTIQRGDDANNIAWLSWMNNTSNANQWGLGLLNGSNNLQVFNYATTSSAAVFDTSGNLGLGVTPSAWGGSYKGFQVNSTGALASNGSNATGVGHNYYFDGTDNKYLTTGAANLYLMINNEHRWYNAASGTAGNAITFTQAMTLDGSGNLMVGGTSASGKLTLTTAEAKAQNATPFVISTSDASNRFELIFSRATNSYYKIQSVEQSVGYRDIVMQSDGGNLLVGTANSVSKLMVLGTQSIFRLATDVSTSPTMNAGQRNSVLCISAPFNADPENVANATAAWGITMAGIGASTAISSSSGKAASMFAVSEDTGAGYNRSVGLAFYTSAFDAAQTERVRIDSLGNVGIGTSSPAVKLDVQAPEGRILLTATTGTNASYLTAVNTGGSFFIGRDNSAGGLSGVAYAAALISTGAYPMLFGTNSAEKMRLDSSGNLGLGVTPKTDWNADYDAFQLGAGSSLSGHTSTSLNFTVLASNQYVNTAGTSKFINDGYAPRYLQRGDTGEHYWYTTNNGLANGNVANTQAMTLDASGNLLVGATNAVGRFTLENAATTTEITLRSTGGVGINNRARIIGGYEAGGSDYGGYLAFNTTTSSNVNTERARITSGGTFQTSLDASIYGVTVGRGGGAVATNTAVGASALTANTTGAFNVAVGTQALTTNTSGERNIAIGRQAMYLNTTGGYNVSVGMNAMEQNTTASYNTALGYVAMQANTTGELNTAVGISSMNGNTTGSRNVAVGNDSLATATTSTDNSAVGSYALRLTTTGAANTALGSYALYSNTTASNNTAVGYQAGYANTTGTYNVLIGYRAGDAITTNGGNCIVGPLAGIGSTGQANTFVGSLVPGVTNGCGTAMTTGSKNTILGGFSGNQGGLDIRTASNYIVLSDGDGNPRWVINGSGTVTTSARFNAASTLDPNGAAVTIRGNFPQTPLELQQDTTNNHYQITFRNNVGTSAALVGSINSDGSYTNYNTGGNPSAAAQLNYQGITFPATQNASSNANTLDDYEEGNWTPTNAGDATGTISNASGEYVKVGRMVYIRGVFTVTNNFTNNSIGGLPFTPSGNTAITSISGATSVPNSATPNLMVAVNIDTSRLVFFTDATTIGGLTSANSTLRVTLVYQASA